MAADLFDLELRAMRRDRAGRSGAELFLLDRAFADCLERIGFTGRAFASALLIGCPDPSWPERLAAMANKVDVFDPGPLFALAAEGSPIIEDKWDASPGHDLCVAVGTLDTVNDLPRALLAIRRSLVPDAFFIGAMAGGETLPHLRSAMRAADEVEGAAVAHAHPRVEASALAGLMTGAGFIDAVVDVDRVQASYRSLDRLVADLRKMGATNILRSRSRTGLPRKALEAARARFLAAAGADGRTVETFEILHFAAWTQGQA
jgi:hypothetical protein